LTIDLVHPESEDEWHRARRLVEEYAASLDVDLSFQNIEREIENLTSEYSPPTGIFLLAKEGGNYLGCVGLRRFTDDAGEIKRLYTVPAARGRGLGRRLAEDIVTAGRQLGYTRLLLDTLPSMEEARSLYVSLGFKPTSAYRFNPVPGTAFLELELR
jgi:GNAT superfamily N-acetyltransferase